MRKLYSFLTYFIAPLLPLYLKKRGKKNPDYLNNWHERFGLSLKNPTSKPIIWFHSVSVGETRAMQELVELVHRAYPSYQILITNMTPTGRATAQMLYPYAIVHYVPYDLSYSVKKFYKNFNPVLGIIMETEIWPNLIHFAHQYSVPLYLVNARLSNKSFNGYNRFKWALLPILNQIKGILCQDTSTAANFTKLEYAGQIAVVGNTKFDLVIPDKIKQLSIEFKNKFGNRKIITFASTREGEEKLFLDNIDLDLDVIYLFIPRHPERFIILEQLLKEKNIIYQKRSENREIDINTKVIIGDSMGEMLAYYYVSYLTIVGGSFTDCGGQNPIESIFMHVPVIFGFSMFNFAEVAKNCLNEGCGIQIMNIDALKDKIKHLIEDHDSYLTIKSGCDMFIEKYQGASNRIFNIIKEEI